MLREDREDNFGGMPRVISNPENQNLKFEVKTREQQPTKRTVYHCSICSQSRERRKDLWNHINVMHRIGRDEVTNYIHEEQVEETMPEERPVGQIRRPSFHGGGGSLFGIHLVNLFLTLVTLGVYYFWGKIRIRSYLLSQAEFEGDRFAYHGTGRELLFGFLKAALVFGVPLTLLRVGPGLLGAGAEIKAGAEFLAGIVVLVLIPVAMVGARRYRLSRTSWRGIRFSFRGQADEFIAIFMGGLFILPFTLGLYYPIFITRQYAFMTSHSYFGNQRFHFDGRGRDLFGSFVLALVPTFLTLLLLRLLPGLGGPIPTPLLVLAIVGFSWLWFSAKRQRYFWDHTSFASARFHSTITVGGLLLLKLGNLLLLVLTLGLDWPWVTVRNIRFTFRHLTLEGSLDLVGIEQEAQAASAAGEALAGFLDAGFDFG
jgi:uncharacterized membrane protein YjgN (DUF898 family)